MFKQKIENGYHPLIPDFVPEKMKDLLKNCWSEKSKICPSINQIVGDLGEVEI